MLIFFPLLYLLQYGFFAIAAPVQNLTDLNTNIAPAWVADPGGRGTWDILYSCTFTIFLCVYTAIYLNVPPEESGFRFWLRKTKWVLIAILAPEIVVYTAFEQWFLSRRFLKKLNSFLDESADEKIKAWVKTYDLKCRFDMVYAQYAVMGGFAADIKHLHNAITERVAITTEGLLFMARHGMFCRIRKDDIQDKSKADLLAKGLVCVQVLWVAGQAIERKIAGFPITLLEVHTLVHIVCAIIMYAFWIRKPLNIKDPTMVYFRDAPDILAFMVEHARQVPENSGTSLSNRPGFIMERFGSPLLPREPTIVWYTNPGKGVEYVEVDDPGKRPEISTATEFTSGDLTQEQVKISTLFGCSHNNVGGITHYYAIGNGDYPVKYVPASNMGVTCKMLSGQVSALGYGPLDSYWKSFYSKQDLLDILAVEVSLSEKDIVRLGSTAEFCTKLKASAIRDSEVLRSSLGEDSVAKSLSAIYYPCTGHSIGREDLLSLRAWNLNGGVLKDIDEETAYLYAAMAIIPTAYGCVHIGALSLIFPSIIERLLWKISCYYLIAAAGTVGVLGLSIYLDDIFYRKGNVNIMTDILDMFGTCWDFIFDRGGFMKFLGKGILLTVLGSIALAYAGARLFLVIESFISLRYVPTGVYETPDVNFMNYIPHL